MAHVIFGMQTEQKANHSSVLFGGELDFIVSDNKCYNQNLTLPSKLALTGKLARSSR